MVFKVNATPTIRQAAPSDRARIKEIINMSFPRFFRFFAAHSISNQDDQIFMSEQEGVVVGRAGFEPATARCLWPAQA
jgi:hypothetical protein